MDRIVVGYDGSDTARKAVEEAASVARDTSAELHVVQVLSAPLIGAGASATDDETDRLRLTFPDLDMEPAVLHGPAARVIVDFATAIEADLIVVGNRRVQGLSRVLGSVAIDVLRNAPCSVYVAHTS